MSKGRLLGKLLGSSGSVPTEKLAGNITIEKLAGDIPITEKFATASLLPATGNIGEQAFVEETNRLYIWNGSGWYNIALINTTPTWDSNGQPASSYDLSADSPQTATTITLAATDPEGTPVSYNYVTGGQMDSIATISQDSSVFTITPKTSVQAPDGGTGSITFRATDGVNILPQVSSFTLNFVTTAENSRYTTLLAIATGTSDNNNIADSSTNNHSITVNGDAHAGTFSPYRSGGYSILFDNTTSGYSGSGTYSIRYAEGTTSDFNMGTNAFTIEGWIKPYDIGSGSRRFYQNRYSSTGNGKGSIFQNGSNLYMSYRGDDGTDYELGPYSVLTANTWAHFCLLRNTSDNTLKLYADGTLLGSVSVPSSVGIYNSGSNTYIGDGFGGEMANIRVINGTAVAPLAGGPTEKPENVTNTVLLLNGPNLVDYSGIAPIHNDPYIYDTPTVKVSSLYDYTKYSATDHGGSVYFDGNTDTIHTASTHNFANNGFSASLWYYPTLAQGALFTSASNHIGSLSFTGSLSSSEIRYEYKNSSGSNTTLIGNNAPNPIYFSWNYLQIVQDSNGHIRIYSNGTQVGSTVTDAAMSGASSTAVTLGDWGSSGSSSGFQGYISDFNLTTETSPSTAVPIAPRSSTSNTKLLISGTDASIIDKSQGANLKLEGSVAGSTNQVRSGAWVNTKTMKFDSVDDLINLNGVLDLSQACTWEAWVYFDNHPDASGFMHMFQSASYSSTNPPFGIRFKTTGGMKINFVLYTTSGNHEVSSPNAISLDTWYHLAFSRTSSGVYNVYIDGTRYSTFTESATYQSSGDVMVIGNSGTGSTPARYLDGYMQDIRITQGLARYTAADESSNIPTEPLEG